VHHTGHPALGARRENGRLWHLRHWTHSASELLWIALLVDPARPAAAPVLTPDMWAARCGRAPPAAASRPQEVKAVRVKGLTLFFVCFFCGVFLCFLVLADYDYELRGESQKKTNKTQSMRVPA